MRATCSDLLSLPAGPRKTALTHMAINLTVVELYVINFWMRMQTPAARESWCGFP